MADSSPYPGTPRWVKIFGIIGTVVLLLLLAMLHGGGGRHARHTPAAGSSGQAPTSGRTEAQKAAGADR
jgi:hypothetical protein